MRNLKYCKFRKMADGIVAPNSYHVFLKNGTEETVGKSWDSKTYF